MLESILITTVFNNIPFFDPIAIDPASHQKKRMNTIHTERVKKLALDNSSKQIYIKTTGFFDGILCLSNAKEQVSSEAMKLTNDIDEQPSVIQRAFAWADDADESTNGLAFDSGEQPSVIEHAFAWTDIDESTPDEVECCMSDDEVSLVSYQNQGKNVSGSVSTATTVTMNTYNTIASWESLNTSPTGLSYDPAMDEEDAPERNSPPPLTIAVLSFKPKPKQRKNAMKFPSLPSVKSMRQMRTLSVANYAY